MYIFLKDFEIKGWYEEYIDDGNPGIGTYTRTVNMMFGKNELLGTSSNKNEKMIVIPNSKYGVSMYGSTAFIETSINFLIDQGILKELTDEEAENIMAMNKAECNLRKSKYKINDFSAWYKQPNSVLDQDDISYFVEIILENIHASGDYSIAKMKLQ